MEVTRMISFKRTLLVVLMGLTSMAILFQLYQIFLPTIPTDRDIKFVELTKQYQILKMEKIVLEEQYALAKTKERVLALAASLQKNYSLSSETKKGQFGLGMSKNVTASESGIPLSAQEAESFQQLEAYVSSNKPNHPAPLTSDEQNILASSGEDFTLQLMGVRDFNELTFFVKENQLEKAQVFHTYYLNKDWYVLISGRYKNHTEALKAMETLPDQIKELKPWIRQLSTIQKAIQLYR